MSARQVLLICGSARKASHTAALTENVAAVLEKMGAQAIIWNLGDRPLPTADPNFHDDPSKHPDHSVKWLVSLATDAHGFVFASPIYHNSYSGVLKNAIDHLTIRQFLYKPVGLLSHGANRSTQAVDHLRIVVRGLLGIATPTHICTQNQDYCEALSGKYELSSEDIMIRIKRFSAEFLAFAEIAETLRKA